MTPPSSSTPAIVSEGLSKRYRIGLREERRGTLAGTTLAWLRQPMRNLARLRGLSRFAATDTADVIWALRDVSFEVPQGEVMGIVGRNGAGKSTLLKILSRITSPTSGRAVLRGRMASLLEVGTGFHPELTGRENVFLNGTLLGMTRHEVARKFDAIVDFSGVSAFIDTPVKRYSSGMYVRLAFAVAAHLEPDILVIDEVLAVGDAEFQRQCLGKMDEVARAGRTVLFVSHNTGAVTRLCTSAILLDRGVVVHRGAAAEVVRHYLAGGGGSRTEWRPDDAHGGDAGGVRLLRVRASASDAAGDGSFDARWPVAVEVEYELRSAMRGLRVGFRLHADDGTVVLSTTDLDEGTRRDRSPGRYVSRCEIPGSLLNRGRYHVSIGIDVPMVESVLFLDGAVSFDVAAAAGIAGSVPDNRLGVICPTIPWTVHRHTTEHGIDRALAV